MIKRPAPPRVTVLSSIVADVPKPASLDHTAVVSWLQIFYRGKSKMIKVVHASGRFDAPVADVVAYWRALRDKYSPDIITGTEAQEPGILAALRVGLGKPYSVRKMGEYPCAVNTKVVRFNRLRPARHKQLTHTIGEPDWRNLFIAVFWLVLIDLKLNICQTIGHTPAGIEMGNSFRSGGDHNRYVFTWQNGLRAWGKYLANRVRTVLCLANGDMNANLREEFWRVERKSRLGTTSVFDRKQPNKGSHAGGRLIDDISFRAGGRAA